MSVNPYHTYDVEESLSDCYKNLSTVSSLWKDILPSTVYCKFIGNHFIKIYIVYKYYILFKIRLY